jgi:c-di-GMP-binding flagellar brake protein YcgR
MYTDKRTSLAGSRADNVRRREPRYVSSVPITVQHFLRFGPIVTRGLSLDVSMGGMSALICAAPQVGETVVITLALPEAKVEMLATVRHSSEDKTGFEFYPLSPSTHQAIQDWIGELKEHEATLFPYAYAGAVRSGDD